MSTHFKKHVEIKLLTGLETIWGIFESDVEQLVLEFYRNLKSYPW